MGIGLGIALNEWRKMRKYKYPFHSYLIVLLNIVVWPVSLIMLFIFKKLVKQHIKNVQRFVNTYGESA